MNWQVAAELNPTNGVPFLLWETRDAANPAAEPELRSTPQPWAVDLALAGPGLTFSASHPTPGEAVELTARVVNLGLKPLTAVGFRVSFFDREPQRGVTPFATQTLHGPLGFGEELPVTVAYTPGNRAWRRFFVVVDADEEVPESDESNNQTAAAWGGLAAPVDFSATPQESLGAVRLGWISPVADGSVRHWLWRTHVRSGETELLGATQGEEFADNTALPGEDYTYQLVAYDPEGVRSETSATDSVTRPEPEPPGAEQLRLSVVSYTDVVTLTWTGLPAVQLEAADELLGGRTQWRPFTDGVDRFGGVAQVTLPAVQGQRFFRLIQP